MVMPQSLARLAAALADSTLVPPRKRPNAAPENLAAHRAAVLVLLTSDTDPQVLLTERSAALRHHAGQVSFPGGTIEAGETAEAAALREAAEEVGLDSGVVSIIGHLPAARIEVSRFSVRIVVGWWDGRSRVAVQDPAEVAALIRVPVSQLAEPSGRMTWVHPTGLTGPGFEIGEMFVWGFTAYVLDAVLRAGGWERPWPTERRVDVPIRFLPDGKSDDQEVSGPMWGARGRSRSDGGPTGR
jgi:8-oxo-dGTP pyrophosphatase MutT (NUDIX family)